MNRIYRIDEKNLIEREEQTKSKRRRSRFDWIIFLFLVIHQSLITFINFQGPRSTLDLKGEKLQQKYNYTYSNHTKNDNQSSSKIGSDSLLDQVETFNQNNDDSSSTVQSLKNDRILSAEKDYEKTGSENFKRSSRLVFLTELIKALINCFMIGLLSKSNDEDLKLKRSKSKPLNEFLRSIYLGLVSDGLKGLALMVIPGSLYTLQNNLSYYSLSRLNPTIFLIFSQLKILSNFLFSVVIFKRSRRGRFNNLIQLLCLITLTIGIIVVKIDDQNNHHYKPRTHYYERNQTGSNDLYNGGGDLEKILSQDQVKDEKEELFHYHDHESWIGLVSILISSICSGLAGTFFEKLSKSNDNSKNNSNKNKSFSIVDEKDLIWVKNLQLSIPTLVISYLILIYNNNFDNQSYTNKNSFRDLYYNKSSNSQSDHSHDNNERSFVLILLSSLKSFFSSFSAIKVDLDAQVFDDLFLIFYNSIGGILVSILIYRFDSIVKSFATCLSIIISGLVSTYLYKSILPSDLFVFGTLLVLISILTYSIFSSSPLSFDFSLPYKRYLSLSKFRSDKFRSKLD